MEIPRGSTGPPEVNVFAGKDKISSHASEYLLEQAKISLALCRHVHSWFQQKLEEMFICRPAPGLVIKSHNLQSTSYKYLHAS